jgi:hypothetical protein
MKTMKLLTFLLLALPAVVQAQSGGGYNYTVNSYTTNTITIVTYTGPGGVVNIPNTINGLLVTGIGNGESTVFGYSSSITNITIPGSVTSIGDGAFSGCSMTNLTIPASVTSIGQSAFYDCTSLISVTSLGSVTSIGDSAFLECTSLTSITIPGSVTIMGGGVFQQCYSLTSVTISNGVTTLGDGDAFEQCTSLTNVTIPASVTNIGLGAFAACTSMTAITVAAQNPTYSSANGVLFDKNQTTLIQFPEAVGGRYTIPGSVTNIAFNAFGRCSLGSVTVPKSITSIGVTNYFSDAFAYCSYLTSVYFLGNAPILLGLNVFASDYNAVVYYLPGTTGWGTTFGGLPTVLWNPQAQTGGASFGVRANKFGFNITGTTNIPIVVEACTNLSSNIWVPLQSVSLTNGLFYFSDPRWTNYPGRFYRLRSP